MQIIKQPRLNQSECHASSDKTVALLPDGLIDNISCARKPYTAPMLIALGTSQIGTGTTSSLAEAHGGVFASAS
jgi:NAD-dependent DNA ligase